MSHSRYFMFGAISAWLGAVMALGGLSCGTFSQQKVSSAVDQATHMCMTVAALACRPDVAEACKTAHDINSLVNPLLMDIASGKTYCRATPDAGQE